MENKLTISIRRHCEKDGDKLTPEGIEHAKEIGKSLVIPEGGIVGYHSPAKRAKETLDYIMESAGVENPEVHENNYRSNVNLLTSIADDLKYGWPSDLEYKEAVKHCLRNEGVAMQKAAIKINGFIMTSLIRHVGGKNFDYYGHVIEFDGKTLADGDVHIEAITHGPMLEAFLTGMYGKKILNEIDDGFNEGDNFLVEFEPNKKGVPAWIEIPHSGTVLPFKDKQARMSHRYSESLRTMHPFADSFDF